MYTTNVESVLTPHNRYEFVSTCMFSFVSAIGKIVLKSNFNPFLLLNLLSRVCRHHAMDLQLIINRSQVGLVHTFL